MEDELYFSICWKKMAEFETVEITGESTENQSTESVDESIADQSAESSGASSTVDSCNNENGAVEMKVTLRGHTGTYRASTKMAREPLDRIS